MIRLEDILANVEKHHPGDDFDMIRRAYIFSAKEHKGQVRASWEPYLTHPLEVANILAEMKMDAVTVSVGLLHDVVEDTLVSLEDVERTFGADVAHIVDGVTKISQIPFTSKEEKQAENFRKMLLAMTDDIRVIMVKFADRLHNMRTPSTLRASGARPLPGRHSRSMHHSCEPARYGKNPRRAGGPLLQLPGAEKLSGAEGSC
jgi:GTP pyrophosphokinase